jgi:hypothetical protein
LWWFVCSSYFAPGKNGAICFEKISSSVLPGYAKENLKNQDFKNNSLTKNKKNGVACS